VGYLGHAFVYTGKETQDMTDLTEYGSNRHAMLLGLLGGAALGALAVALTTPKTGRELRNTLKNAARKLRGKSLDTMDVDDVDTGTIDALFI
jgi:hypothetical protein